MRHSHWFPLVLVATLSAGCASHEIPTDPVAHHITVLTEPAGATVHFDPGIIAVSSVGAPQAATATAESGYHDTLPTVATPIECFVIPHHPTMAGGAPARFIVVEKPGYARKVVELTPEKIDAIGGEYVYDHIFLRLALQPMAK